MSGIFHLESPRKKHEENSNRGDEEAVKKDCWGTDHDELKGKSGKSYNTHWPDPFRRDGFVDPKGEYGPGTPHPKAKIWNLPDEVIERLVAHTNGHTFHIRTTEQGIIHAAESGLDRVFTEAKPLPKWSGQKWTIADFRRWKKVARDHHIGLTIMTMDSHEGWRRILWKAKMAGCRTRRLHMPGPTAKGW